MSDRSASNFLRCADELVDVDDRSGAETLPRPLFSSPYDESSFIAWLLDSEPQFMPQGDYFCLCQNRAVHITSRQDCINYMLKVHAHFQFKPVTAFLSINYFDRFLSCYALPDTGRHFHLLSVTCLSTAAKMEELNVPLLLDLQMLETNYVFEPETIQRMELLVMSTLKWRLRSITPFDYLHHFISMLPSSAAMSDLVSVRHDFASNIIINTTRVVDFLRFPPSVIAAASAISARGEDGANMLDVLDDRVDREMVRSCHLLMEEYLLDTCPSEGIKVLSFEQPPSPSGVLDEAVCVSRYSHSEHRAIVLVSEPGEAEPENKRRRLYAPDIQEPAP